MSLSKKLAVEEYMKKYLNWRGKRIYILVRRQMSRHHKWVTWLNLPQSFLGNIVLNPLLSRLLASPYRFPDLPCALPHFSISEIPSSSLFFLSTPTFPSVTVQRSYHWWRHCWSLLPKTISTFTLEAFSIQFYDNT